MVGLPKFSSISFIQISTKIVSQVWKCTIQISTIWLVWTRDSTKLQCRQVNIQNINHINRKLHQRPSKAALPRYGRGLSLGLVQKVTTTENFNKIYKISAQNFHKTQNKWAKFEGTPKSFKTYTKIQLEAWNALKTQV